MAVCLITAQPFGIKSAAMALKLGNTLNSVVSRWSCACRPLPLAPGLGRALSSVQKPVIAAAAAAGDIMDDIDWTEDMPVPVKRRVRALKEVQGQYDELMRDFIKERAELQAKYEKAAEPLMSKRKGIVGGSEAVSNYDIADSEEQDQGIPDFWLTAMANHDMIGEYVTERDADVLSNLRDVRVVSLTGDDAGSFRLEFQFEKNPFFTNEMLEKTFYMENPDEVVPEKFVGCTINWAAGKDTTVEQVKKKSKGKKGAPAVVVTQNKPCDSFFNFFKTPAIPENPEDLSEEELEALQQQMDEDYELATAFKESLIPRAVEWFTGEISPPMFDDEFEEGFDDDDDFEEPPRRR